MKRVLACLFVIGLAFTVIVGCSSIQVAKDPNATQAQKDAAKTADCTNLQTYITEATMEINNLNKAGVVGGGVVTYWTLGIQGAQLGMMAAGCVPATPITNPPAAVSTVPITPVPNLTVVTTPSAVPTTPVPTVTK